MSKQTKAEQERAVEQLREWLPKGSTVNTILEHVSKSGMSRSIRVIVPYVSDHSGKIEFIHPNHAISVALGWSRSKRPLEGVRVGGCGMDMGFHLVYTLSSVLYGDGYALYHRWV